MAAYLKRRGRHNWLSPKPVNGNAGLLPDKGCGRIPQNANKIQAAGALPDLLKTTHFSTYPQIEKAIVTEKTSN
ncbi:hypothetical protein [Paraburkholderia aromaticivorans]|uniref:hypothetical protein n=1 Tax=Paraburkholderia aromaticivorans TaxID=2026199 RepID=UPI0012FDD799|nr:hypothetical protein [Paraburkholderia aromaticivorans]